MSKKITCVLSFVLVFALVSTGYGEVIDSFETGVDVWEIMDPAETLVQATEGVTDGSYSMQRNFTSGWHEIDLGGVSVDVLNGNDILEVDVTSSVTAEQMGWWLEQAIVLQGGNASGSYYLQSPVVNVASPDGTSTTTTVSFEYRSLLVDGPITDWAKIRLVDNTGPGPNGILYYDNLRAVTAAPPSEMTTVTIGDFEGDLSGWWAGADFTLSNSTIGATLGAQAMQVDGPGSWHIDALMNLKPHQETMAEPGLKIMADITAFEADMTTTWMNVIMVINGQNNDDNGTNNNVGWQELGTQDVVRDGQPHTYTWDVPEALSAVLAGVDDNISWYELVLATNVDGASVTKFYIDNIQLSGPATVVAPPKSTDTIIGNWEQDLDQWVAGANTDVLFNDHNGVTLGDHSLDVFLAAGGGWQDDVLQLNLLEAGLLDAFKANSVVSLDITRLVADWPSDNTPGWNEIALVLNTGGDGWSLWQNMGVRANWYPSDGDETVTVTWDYSQYFPQINYLEGVTWLELFIVSNVDGNYDGTTWFYLDNMKLIGAGVPLDQTPADGSGDVSTDTKLLWTPRDVVTKHHLYFGTDQTKVDGALMDSDPDVTFMELDDAYFDPNGLEFGTQYFWRIDEVNEANPDSPWRGPVWSFSTAIFGVVDDFESYNTLNPDLPGSNRLFEVWSDGFGDETNGALAGHDYLPYTEDAIVNNGSQSMPVYYDNTGAALKSEVQRVWAEPQDWTIERFNVLKLSAHGFAQNKPGELYVIIEDAAGNSYTASNPDSGILTAEQWQGWEISLDDVAAAGVDLTAVTKLVIGVADLAGQAEASGMFYVDDIRIQRALSSDNILTNGGFEEGPTMPLNTWDPLSWSQYDCTTFEVVSELTSAAVPEPPIEGQYCLHVVAPQGANFWDSGVANLIDYDVNIGVHYTVSLFMKSKQGTADVNVKFEHTPGPPHTAYAEQMATVTEEWTEFSITSQPFTSKVKARIVLHVAAQDTDIWVDNVRFYEGDYVPPPSN